MKIGECPACGEEVVLATQLGGTQVILDRMPARYYVVPKDNPLYVSETVGYARHLSSCTAAPERTVVAHQATDEESDDVDTVDETSNLDARSLPEGSEVLIHEPALLKGVEERTKQK